MFSKRRPPYHTINLLSKILPRETRGDPRSKRTVPAKKKIKRMLVNVLKETTTPPHHQLKDPSKGNRRRSKTQKSRSCKKENKENVSER
jgi:hypothetical protein